jgi:lipopolysaccharide/colanic/teichoic acid biosynthesis glycosyltransferase
MKIKMILDRLIAFIALIILFPLLLLVSILLISSSKGPVLFRQTRIGQFGKTFTILKFRTMRVNDDPNTISIKDDTRITFIGKYLRKYKLDELPELINIFRGEMSFVGPRPDVAGYMDKLGEEDKEILSLKPGITGPASLKYINEEEILCHVENPRKYNDMIIFPDKVRINKLYLDNWSLGLDIKIILHTFIRKDYNEKNYFIKS